MNREGTRWRGQLPIPDHAHPLVRQFFRELNEQQTTMAEVAKRSAVDRHTLSNWRYRSDASLSNFVAALNVIGLELFIRPQGSGRGRPRKTSERVQ